MPIHTPREPLGHSAPPLQHPRRALTGGGPPRAPLAALAGARRGYYYRAVLYCTTPAIGRPAISKNRAAEQYRIRDLGIAWGPRLDDLHASLQMIRWVADAHAEQFHAEREKRYRAVVKLLEESEDRSKVWKDFDALKASMPKVGRQSAGVRRPSGRGKPKKKAG